MRAVLSSVLNSVVMVVTMIVLVLTVPVLHRMYTQAKVGSSVVKLVGVLGMGTGFQVKAPSGKEYILTNKHVCNLALDGTLTAVQNEKIIGQVAVVQKSQVTDLCLMTPIKKLSGLTLGDAPYSNQEITSVGHPYGLQLTLSRGGVIGGQEIEMLVGILGLTMKEEDCQGKAFRQVPINTTKNTNPLDYTPTKSSYKHLLFLRDLSAAPIAPTGRLMGCVMKMSTINTTIQVLGGNSGSPVVNSRGNVVGVIFARYGETAWGAMVHYNDIKKFLEKR